MSRSRRSTKSPAKPCRTNFCDCGRARHDRGFMTHSVLKQCSCRSESWCSRRGPAASLRRSMCRFPVRARRPSAACPILPRSPEHIRRQMRAGRADIERALTWMVKRRAALPAGRLGLRRVFRSMGAGRAAPAYAAGDLAPAVVIFAKIYKQCLLLFNTWPTCVAITLGFARCGALRDLFSRSASPIRAPCAS